MVQFWGLSFVKSEFTVDCSTGGTGSLQVEVTGPIGKIGTEETIDRACIAVQFWGLSCVIKNTWNVNG